ncbi:DUF805 domain-containing protein [Sphingobium sp. HBC34]|uniref:DUF805 domain-containing protein n=1 Tax=Sphingobium cyanobacteriorum TaxID=3063954 RepID=A0ABT8ZS54_9SPHN|nr:DUF805 domain-containing protein [Sphingobium sp. HBC34]MDO7836933.1 DUF805 domain-containing protein [Sphingobium sp. HBC34]
MEYMFLPLRRYADFSGRSRRKEYWMFALFYFLLLGALFVMSDITGGDSGRFGSPLIILFGIAILALFIPSLAVQVRRFHDQDKSGWFVLLNFIPYVGGIIVLVFMCLEGTRGENRFGPDPKQTAMDVGDIFN